MSAGALDAVDRILNRGGAPVEVLHAVAGTLVERGGCAWAAILLADGGELVPAAYAGEERPDERARIAIVFGGDKVGELAADGCDDHAFLERVALVVSPYCTRPAAAEPPEGAP
jgi:hypothetical protein